MAFRRESSFAVQFTQFCLQVRHYYALAAMLTISWLRTYRKGSSADAGVSRGDASEFRSQEMVNIAAMLFFP